MGESNNYSRRQTEKINKIERFKSFKGTDWPGEIDLENVEISAFPSNLRSVGGIYAPKIGVRELKLDSVRLAVWCNQAPALESVKIEHVGRAVFFNDSPLLSSVEIRTIGNQCNLSGCPNLNNLKLQKVFSFLSLTNTSITLKQISSFDGEKIIIECGELFIGNSSLEQASDAEILQVFSVDPQGINRMRD